MDGLIRRFKKGVNYQRDAFSGVLWKNAVFFDEGDLIPVQFIFLDRFNFVFYICIADYVIDRSIKIYGKLFKGGYIGFIGAGFIRVYLRLR